MTASMTDRQIEIAALRILEAADYDYVAAAQDVDIHAFGSYADGVRVRDTLTAWSRAFAAEYGDNA